MGTERKSHGKAEETDDPQPPTQPCGGWETEQENEQRKTDDTPNPHPAPSQTDARGAASMERRAKERSACGALMQQDRKRVRALDGGRREGKGVNRDAFARQDRACACICIYVRGLSGVKRTKYPMTKYPRLKRAFLQSHRNQRGKNNPGLSARKTCA